MVKDPKRIQAEESHFGHTVEYARIYWPLVISFCNHCFQILSWGRIYQYTDEHSKHEIITGSPLRP